jgi:hypothetical protein
VGWIEVVLLEISTLVLIWGREEVTGAQGIVRDVFERGRGVGSED